MKSFFVLTAVIAVALSSVAAEWKRPSANTSDSAALAALAASAEKTSDKFYIAAIQALNASPAKDMAGLIATIDGIGAKYELPAETISYYHKFFAVNRRDCRKFLAEACQYCIQNPSSYDRHYITRDFAKKHFTKEQLYTISRRFLLEHTFKAAMTLKLLDTFIFAADGVDAKTVKADLVRFNRKYSLLLVADKAAWTPVVQAIRTAMETY